jgi:hypothetical protein
LAQSSSAGGRSPRERLGRERHIHRMEPEVVARAERVQGRLGPSGVSMPVAHAGSPGIPSHWADDHRPAMPLHPCRRASSHGVSGDPRTREWIPTLRDVTMSGGSCLPFQLRTEHLPQPSAK